MSNLTRRIMPLAKKVLHLSGSISIQNYTDEDCYIAQHASCNSLMQTIRFVHIMLCVMGIVTSSLFIYVLVSKKCSLLHINLRLSLCSLSMAALVASIQLLYIAGYSLIHSLSTSSPCEFLYDAYHCAVIRFPVVLAIYATILGMIVIAVERAIATVKYRTYEAHGSWLVGGILIVIQWSISIGLAFFSTIVRHDSGFVHYCTAYISHPKSSVVSISAMTIMELATLIFFIALLHVNKYKQVHEFVNNALHTLTERYQLQENVRIMQALIPSVTVHAVLSIAGLVALLIFAIMYSSLDARMVARFAPYSEMVMLLVPIYATVLPLVAIVRNQQLRQATKGALPFLFNHTNSASSNGAVRDHRVLLCDMGSGRTSKQIEQIEQDADTHFDLINEMWSK